MATFAIKNKVVDADGFTHVHLVDFFGKHFIYVYNKEGKLHATKGGITEEQAMGHLTTVNRLSNDIRSAQATPSTDKSDQVTFDVGYIKAVVKQMELTVTNLNGSIKFFKEILAKYE